MVLAGFIADRAPAAGMDLAMSLDQAESLAKRSIGRLHDAADDIVDDVKSEARGRVRKAKGAVHGAYERTRHRAEDAVDDVHGYLRDQSLVTLGVGVAIGLFMSFALRNGAKPPKVGAPARPDRHD